MKNKILRNMLIPGISAVVVVAVPALLINFFIIDAYTAQILTLAGINAIMALSVNIICGITGQLSLGQAGFMAIGAYTTVLLSAGASIPLPFSIIIAGFVTAFFGFLIGFPTLKLEGDYLAIVTLGFGEIIRVILVNLKSLTGGPNGKQFPTVLTLNPAVAYFVIIGVLTILVILIQNFIRSTYGRAIIAVREDEIAANSNGIGVFRYKMVGFVIASFVAGVGGALYAPFIGFIKPDMASFTRSIDYLIYVVLGGMGSTTGSVLASFVLTSLQEFLRFLQNYRLLFYPVILILVMQFRPQGLLGTKEFSFVKTWDGIPEFFRKVNVFLSLPLEEKIHIITRVFSQKNKGGFLGCYFNITGNYCVFTGRLERKVFWKAVAVYILFGSIIGLIDTHLGLHFLLLSVYYLVTYLPFLGASIRRLHDIGRCGWWVLCPVVCLVFYCFKGACEDNIYGPVNPGIAVYNEKELENA